MTDEVTEEYDEIIQAVLNAQKGFIQPFIFSSAHLIRYLRISQCDFL
jgi:hypothetical protein